MSVCRGSIPPISEARSQWCHTKVKASSFRYTWSIDNFSLCVQQTGECLRSSIFSGDEREWRLNLFPRGEDEESEDYLSVFLELVSSRRSQTHAKIRFAIIDAFQNKRNRKKVKEHQLCLFDLETSWGVWDFIERDAILHDFDLLVDDQLTVTCNVSIIGDTVTEPNQSNPVKVPECRLGEELGSLLENSDYSDVDLCVGDQEFKVHKLIITARSPVFRAMFEHRMRERESNRVEITDVDKEVMGEMLHFIYTGRAPNVEKMAAKLLVAADKYDLKTLKVMCEEALCSNLLIDNACEILALADRHSADQLKSRAIDFIKSHAAAVMKSAAWKDIVSSNPQLVSEFVMAMISRESPPREPPFKRMKHS